MVTGKPELITFSFSHTEEEGVSFNPFIRKYPQGAVVQRHKLLFVGKRFFYIRNGHLLISEKNINPGVEPVGATADMDFCLRTGSIEAEVFQRFKTLYGHFHILHGIHEKKKPIVLQHVASF